MSNEIQLPAHTQKRIYWPEDGTGRAFILIGYCPDTLAYFQAMYAEARKSFPELRPENCTCGKVTGSRTVQGFTLLSFPLTGEKHEIEGWEMLSGYSDIYY